MAAETAHKADQYNPDSREIQIVAFLVASCNPFFLLASARLAHAKIKVRSNSTTEVLGIILAACETDSEP